MAITNVYLTASVSGDIVNPTNAYGVADGSWAGELNTNTSWTHRWGYADQSGLGADTGNQVFTIRARKGSNGNSPVLTTITIYQGGVSAFVDSTGYTITSTTGEDIVVTVPDGNLSVLFDIDIEIVMSAAGGSPTARNSAQIDSIQWAVQTNSATPVTVNPAVINFTEAVLGTTVATETFISGVANSTTTVTPATLTQRGSMEVAYGGELITNGTFDTDTDWTKSGTPTIAGGVLTLGASDWVRQFREGILVENTLYKVDWNIVENGGSSVYIYLGNNNAVLYGNLAVDFYSEKKKTRDAFHDASWMNITLLTTSGTTGNYVLDNFSVKKVLSIIQFTTSATLTARCQMFAVGDGVNRLTDWDFSNNNAGGEWDSVTGGWVIAGGQATNDGTASSRIRQPSLLTAAGWNHYRWFFGASIRDYVSGGLDRLYLGSVSSKFVGWGENGVFGDYILHDGTGLVGYDWRNVDLNGTFDDAFLMQAATVKFTTSATLTARVSLVTLDTLGAEIVTNGTFDVSVSPWFHNATRGTLSSVGGKAQLVDDVPTSTTTCGAQYSVSGQVLKNRAYAYALDIDTTSAATGALLSITNLGSFSNEETNIPTGFNKRVSGKVRCDDGGFAFIVYLRVFGGTGETILFDNVTIKEVIPNSAFTSTATLTQRGKLVAGTQLVSNWEFDTDTIWNVINNGTTYQNEIIDGVLKVNSTATFARQVDQTLSFATGQRFAFVWRMLNYVTGDISARQGASGGNTILSSNTNGVFRTSFIGINEPLLEIRSSGAAVQGDIDYISIKEMDSAFTTTANLTSAGGTNVTVNPNVIAFTETLLATTVTAQTLISGTANSTFTTSATLTQRGQLLGYKVGAELIIDGGFDVPANWSLETEWTIVNGVLESPTVTSGYARPNPNISITSGKQYFVFWNCIRSGAQNSYINVVMGGWTTAGVNYYVCLPSEQGKGVAAKLTAEGNDFRIYGNVTQGNGAIDNLSVKEILIDSAFSTTANLVDGGSGAITVNVNAIAFSETILSPTINVVQNTFVNVSLGSTVYPTGTPASPVGEGASVSNWLPFNSPAISSDSTTAYKGALSVKGENTVGGTTVMYLTNICEINKTYYIQFSAKVNINGTQKLNLYGPGEGWTITQDVEINSTEWAVYSLTATRTGSNGGDFNFWVGNTIGHALWIDNFIAKEVLPLTFNETVNPVTVSTAGAVTVNPNVINFTEALLSPSVQAVTNISVNANTINFTEAVLPTTVTANREATINANAVNFVEAVNPASVSTAGAVTINANVINFTESIGSVSVQADKSVSVSVNAVTFNEAVLPVSVATGGSVTVNPNAVAFNEALNPVTVTANRDVSISVNAVNFTEAVNPVSVSTSGGVVVNANAISFVEAVLGATVTTVRNATINPDPINFSLTAEAVTVSIPVVVGVNTIAIAVDLQSVTVSASQNVVVSPSTISYILDTLVPSVITQQFVQANVSAINFGLNQLPATVSVVVDTDLIRVYMDAILVETTILEEITLNTNEINEIAELCQTQKLLTEPL